MIEEVSAVNFGLEELILLTLVKMYLILQMGFMGFSMKNLRQNQETMVFDF